MSVQAPQTMEGHYVLHFAYHVDWQSLNALPAEDKQRIVDEATQWFERTSKLDEGGTGLYSLVGGKGDLFVMHIRPTIEEVNAAEIDFAQLELNQFLNQSYSYISVTELSVHGDPEQRRHAMLKRQGLEPGTDEWDLAMETLVEEQEEIQRKRLRPKVPEHRYMCFYPMSKKRDETVNWYKLTSKERGMLMRDHANVGRKYIGTVLQLVTGSVGFDDWEWGVTLFTNEAVQFKKLIYEMRFDVASADYALFGPFYVGIQLQSEQLPTLLSGTFPG